MIDSDDAVFGVYVALWRQAEADGIFVHYDVPPTAASGGYHPRDDSPGAGPMIAISRPYYVDETTPSRERNAGAPTTMPPPDILAETITLAHEYGHHRSYLGGNRTPSYVEAVTQIERYYACEDVPPLTEEQKNLVRAEEQRAWDGGRAILRELGFSRFDVFDAKERNDLEQYEIIFRWETLPWHIDIVFDWCREHSDSEVVAAAFLRERKTFYAVLSTHATDEYDQQRLYKATIWSAERDAIEASRSHRRSPDLRSVRAAVEACVERYRTEGLRLASGAYDGR